MPQRTCDAVAKSPGARSVDGGDDAQELPGGRKRVSQRDLPFPRPLPGLAQSLILYASAIMPLDPNPYRNLDGDKPVTRAVLIGEIVLWTVLWLWQAWRSIAGHNGSVGILIGAPIAIAVVAFKLMRLNRAI